MTQPTRRTILATAAWTVPVIAACAPAPAFAASGFTCAPSYCKVQNRSNANGWDFTVYVNGRVSGVPTNPSSVTINGKTATLRYDSKGRAYYDLRNQPHSYIFAVKIFAPNGALAYDKVVDTRQSACPS